MAFVASISSSSFIGQKSQSFACPSSLKETSLTKPTRNVARMAFSSIDAPETAVTAFDKSVESSDMVIYAAYKQIFGNAYLMEWEREEYAELESDFRLGKLEVRDFVRGLAKGYAYRKRYFERCGPHRFIELNMKHLLGRAPSSPEEISQHVKLLAEQGYDAEIDSYIDSEEYVSMFGVDTVPRFIFKGTYPRNDDFNRMCIMRSHWDGCSTSTISGSTAPTSKIKAKLIMTQGAHCSNPIAIQRGIRADHKQKDLAPNPKSLPEAPLNANAGVRVRVKIVENLYRVFETDPVLPKVEPAWKKERSGVKKWNGVWF